VQILTSPVDTGFSSAGASFLASNFQVAFPLIIKLEPDPLYLVVSKFLTKL